MTDKPASPAGFPWLLSGSIGGNVQTDLQIDESILDLKRRMERILRLAAGEPVMIDFPVRVSSEPIGPDSITVPLISPETMREQSRVYCDFVRGVDNLLQYPIHQKRLNAEGERIALAIRERAVEHGHSEREERLYATRNAFMLALEFLLELPPEKWTKKLRTKVSGITAEDFLGLRIGQYKGEKTLLFTDHESNTEILKGQN